MHSCIQIMCNDLNDWEQGTCEKPKPTKARANVPFALWSLYHVTVIILPTLSHTGTSRCSALTGKCMRFNVHCTFYATSPSWPEPESALDIAPYVQITDISIAIWWDMMYVGRLFTISIATRHIITEIGKVFKNIKIADNSREYAVHSHRLYKWFVMLTECRQRRVLLLLCCPGCGRKQTSLH